MARHATVYHKDQNQLPTYIAARRGMDGFLDLLIKVKADYNSPNETVGDKV